MATDFSTSRIKAKHRQEKLEWWEQLSTANEHRCLLLPANTDQTLMHLDRFPNAKLHLVEKKYLIYSQYLRRWCITHPNQVKAFNESVASSLVVAPSLKDWYQIPMTYGDIDLMGHFDSGGTKTFDVQKRLMKASSKYETCFSWTHDIQDRKKPYTLNALKKCAVEFPHGAHYTEDVSNWGEHNTLDIRMRYIQHAWMLGLSAGVYSGNAVYIDLAQEYRLSRHGHWMSRVFIRTDPRSSFDIEDLWSQLVRL